MDDIWLVICCWLKPPTLRAGVIRYGLLAVTDSVTEASVGITVTLLAKGIVGSTLVMIPSIMLSLSQKEYPCPANVSVPFDPWFCFRTWNTRGCPGPAA